MTETTGLTHVDTETGDPVTVGVLLPNTQGKVSPAELEDLLETHSDVEDCAVIGVPDRQSGEVPKAFVVKSRGSSVSQTDLQEFVAANLDAHKHLRGGVEFVDQIPRSPTGQIIRGVLKKQA
ncbi:putative acyl-coenzyme A synthetase [Haliotis rubra]|uniref:putative acyl-coenzyme A synthetase n=1 Tax=Haliotis rubra TaxID=36100 RepID=UPI001EE5A576|nr:putative acyl-coenzyme A synthetase [Haliotis rubra]